MKYAGIFLGRKKKTERFFGVAEKGPRDFFGYAKKNSDIFGLLLLDPPPSLKFVSGAPGAQSLFDNSVKQMFYKKFYILPHSLPRPASDHHIQPRTSFLSINRLLCNLQQV